MTRPQITLGKIIANNLKIARSEAKRVLVLFEEKFSQIGDTCMQLDQLKFCRTFFESASIDINCLNEKFYKLYETLLKNNPNIDALTCQSWDQINFENYDIVLCASYHEDEFLRFFDSKYGDLIIKGDLETAIFSVSRSILPPVEIKDNITFPDYEQFYTFVQIIRELQDRPLYIYISNEEKEWGNNWLKENGLRDHESLFVLLDSSTQRHKLLDINVYFEVLSHILSSKGARVLIFDEKDVGKAAFYREWLGDELADRIIYSRCLSLRQDLCLLSSDYVKVIMGPCTGLLHCSSGIYNHFVGNGTPREKVPLMITYTGKYLKANQNANTWWGNAPLVHCLIIKEISGKKEVVLLNDLNEEERESNDNTLTCNEYTADMLINFLDKKCLNQLR